jgi:hypothetical protein
MATTSRVPNKLTAPASARCSKVGGLKTCEGAGFFVAAARLRDVDEDRRYDASRRAHARRDALGQPIVWSRPNRHASNLDACWRQRDNKRPVGRRYQAHARLAGTPSCPRRLSTSQAF